MLSVLYTFISCQTILGVEFSDDGLTLIRGNPNLIEYTIPAFVTILQDGSEEYNCFGHCIKTTTIKFEKDNNLSRIGNFAFYYTLLSSIDLSACTKLQVIGANAFMNSKISSITFADNIYQIGTNAFHSTKLTQVTFPKNLESVIFWSFGFCPDLKSIIFKKDCLTKNIYSEAFISSGITTVEIPKSVQLLQSAFFGCPLTSITIHPENKNYIESDGVVYTSGFRSIIFSVKYIQNDIISIGINAFRSTTFESIVLNDGLERIEQGAFWQTSIRSISIPSSLVTCEGYAFVGCTLLSSVEFNSKIKVLNISTFDGCRSLKRIEIQKGAETIMKNCFMGCAKLEYVWVPNTVTQIDGGAFSGINKTCDIVFEENSTLIIKDSLLYTRYFKKLIGCLDTNDQSLLMVHWNTTVIASSAFKESKISEVSFYENSSLVTIEDSAFYMSSITKITMPDTVTALGASCFKQSENLRNVNFSINLRSILKECFMDCKNLEAIYLPPSVSSVSESAFSGCVSAKHLSFGLNSSVIAVGRYCFLGVSALFIELPPRLRDGGYYGFSMPNLESINVPDKCEIKEITQHMFAGCIALKSIQLGSSVQTLNEGAFLDCISLESFQLPKSVQSILSYAFRNCTKLNYFEIPYGSQLSTIRSIAFYECSSLKKLTVSASNTNFKAVECCLYDYDQKVLILYLPSDLRDFFDVPPSVEAIGDYAFQDCVNLRHINLSSNLSQIGVLAFSGCSSLIWVGVVESLDLVQDMAFTGCVSLECGINYFSEAQHDMLVWAGMSKEALAPCPTKLFSPGQHSDVAICCAFTNFVYD